MKTSLFLPLCFLLLSPPVLASGEWPDLALARAQDRLRTGPCPTPKKEDPTPQYIQDLCRQYGLTNAAKPSWRLTQTKASSLEFKTDSRTFHIDREAEASVYKINQRGLEVKHLSQPELQEQIEKALRPPRTAGSVWITPAYAETSEKEIALALQLLITETELTENCQLYLDFGGQCMKGTQKVLKALKKNPANEGEISQLSKSLSRLQMQIQKKIVAPLDGYDLVRQCSYLRDPRNGQQVAAEAETQLRNCQRVVQEVRLALNNQPGKREKDLDGIESLISKLYLEKQQSLGADTPGKADGIH